MILNYYSHFLFFVAISLLDIVIESFYQLFILYFFNQFILLFPKTEGLLNKELTENIIHTARGSLIHIFIGLTLISTVVGLFILILTPTFRKTVFGLVRPILDIFPAFYSISSFEMLILQIQCLVIRYFESRWIWNLFISENSPFNRLWIVFVFSILAPLEMRFKIFMEEKFHSNSVIIIGFVHALSCAVYPYFQLLCILNFSHPKIDSINFDLPKDLNFFKNVSLVSIHPHSHHLKITPIGFFNRNYFIVEGAHNLKIEDLSATMLYDSYKFNTFHIILSFIIPFIVNMLFAFLAIQISKRYLKHLHIEDIHHITTYLILEEFLNLGFYKYLYAPYRGLEKLFIIRHDLDVNKYLNSLDNKENHLRLFIEQEIKGHRNVCSSPMSIFFSSYMTTLDRVEKVL